MRINIYTGHEIKNRTKSHIMQTGESSSSSSSSTIATPVTESLPSTPYTPHKIEPTEIEISTTTIGIPIYFQMRNK